MKKKAENILLILLGILLLTIGILMFCNINANAQQVSIYNNGFMVGTVEQTWGGWVELRDMGGNLLLDTYGNSINIHTPMQAPAQPSTSEKLLYWYLSTNTTDDGQVIITPPATGGKVDMSQFEYHPPKIEGAHIGQSLPFLKYMSDSIK